MGCAAQEGEKECGRGSWADQIEPETRGRDVFYLFHFVNILLELKIQIFFTSNKF